jgi:membrane protein
MDERHAPLERVFASVDAAIDRLPQPARRVVACFREEEDLLLLAGGLAFYALVSVAPLMVLALWITSAAVGDDAVKRTGEEMARLAPGNLGVDYAFERVARAGTEVGVWAVIAALWPATAYGAGLVRTFNRLSHRSLRLPGLRGRVMTLVLMAALQVVVLSGLALAVVGPRLVGRSVPAPAAGWALALGAGFVSLAAMTSLIYRVFVPDDVTHRRVVQGAAAVAVSVSALSAGYVLFLQLGTNFEERYVTSGLAAVVLLGVWLFLANTLLLVGYRFVND